MKKEFLILFNFVFAVFEVVYCLRNVSLVLDPEHVERYQNCTLRCTYDLEGAPLYTVKFFRGNHEFYRLTPSETPKIKFFPTLGINVDTKNSNGTQVVLTKIDFELSGDFSCEVTTDLSFSTGIDTKMMEVIQIPKQPPQLWVDRQSFNSGHILYAKCSLALSRPPPVLKILINNETVLATGEFYTISLTRFGIFDGHTRVGCVAQILDLYEKIVEIQLDDIKDPISEQVSADNGKGKSCFNPLFVIFVVVMKIYIQGV